MVRTVLFVALIGVLLVAVSGCRFWDPAKRSTGAPGQTEPWWCTSRSGPALDQAGRKSLAAQLAQARGAALGLPPAADAVAGGATAHAYADGVGARFVLRAPSSTMD